MGWWLRCNQVNSREQAVAWARKFLELHKQLCAGWEGTVEVRQIMQQPDT